MKRNPKRTSRDDDVTTLLATLPAGPAFLDLGRRQAAGVPSRDAARIRGYFSKALGRLRPGPAGR